MQNYDPVNRLRVKVMGIGLEGSGFARLVSKKDTDFYKELRSGEIPMKDDGAEYCAVAYQSDVLYSSTFKDQIQLYPLGDITYESSRERVERSRKELTAQIKGMDVLYLLAALGDEATSGAVVAIAALARELGVYTIAAVTEPFEWEGEKRALFAARAIEELCGIADAVMRFPFAEAEGAVAEAYRSTEEALVNTVVSLNEMLCVPSVINLDFGDVKTVCGDGSCVYVGLGTGSGSKPVISAMRSALGSPFLKSRLPLSDKIILYVCGGEDTELSDMNEAIFELKDAVNKDAYILFGAGLKSGVTSKSSVVLLAGLKGKKK